MSYLGGSLAAMVADRNLWQGRANTAWGASSVWGSGNSYQTDLTAMTADRNLWQSRANQAYTGGVWGSGVLWSSAAGGDPNVYTNRYNAGYSDGNTAGYAAGSSAGYSSGYAAADAAESPRALSTYNFTGTTTANGSLNLVTISGAGEGGVLVNNGSSLTAVRPGYWMIAAKVNGYNNTGVTIYTEGAQRAIENGTPNAADYLAGVSTWWVGFINASGSIQFQGRANTVCTLTMTVTFVPTPGYQQ